MVNLTVDNIHLTKLLDYNCNFHVYDQRIYTVSEKLIIFLGGKKSLTGLLVSYR
jgi:hypothetical protein